MLARRRSAGGPAPRERSPVEGSLERQQMLLARELAVLEEAKAGLPSPHPDEWRGEAQALYALCLLKLQWDVQVAIDRVRSALTLTTTALGTVRGRG